MVVVTRRQAGTRLGWAGLVHYRLQAQITDKVLLRPELKSQSLSSRQLNLISAKICISGGKILQSFLFLIILTGDLHVLGHNSPDIDQSGPAWTGSQDKFCVSEL